MIRIQKDVMKFGSFFIEEWTDKYYWLIKFDLHLNRSLAFFDSPPLLFSDFTSEELTNF